jgi:fibronectin type 3 domain-containing protein
MSGSSTLGTGSVSNSTATYSISTLPVGSDTITAVYGANGNYAGSTSSAVSETVNLAAPTGLTATAGTGQVALAWSTVSGAATYNVYRGTTSNGESSTALATGLTTAAYADTSVAAGTTYYYEVTAISGSAASGKSNEATAATAVAIAAAPTSLAAVGSNGQVALTWTASATAASYNIYRGTASGAESATPIATGISATSFTDSTVTNGVTYYYKVTAVNTGGVSAYSNEASAAPHASVAAVPTGLSAGPGYSQVTLAWNLSNGAVSYNIYRGTASGAEGTTARVNSSGTL